ncbi:MAG: NAD-dependent epimerase/dehydratase family protein [Bryobacteraceae bacterium]
MRVFLTGATGYIGSVVAEALMDAGHDVLGLARSDERARQLESRRIEVHRGDFADPASLAAAARDADAVIHAAMSFGKPDTPAVDRGAVEAMLNAMEGSGRPFIYTSGVWVVGPTFGRVAGELSPLMPPKVVEWRPAVEQLVVDAADRRIRGVVLRPGMVFGRRGGFVAGLLRQAQEQGVIRVVGTGENHVTCVHVEDLAKLYVLAAEKGPSGEVFLAVDGPAVPVKAIAEAVAKTCGASIEAWPLEEARKTIGLMADALVLDQKFASTKAARVLGWYAECPTVLQEIEQGGYS